MLCCAGGWSRGEEEGLTTSGRTRPTLLLKENSRKFCVFEISPGWSGKSYKWILEGARAVRRPKQLPKSEKWGLSPRLWKGGRGDKFTRDLGDGMGLGG